jgi:hypothetical protein
MAFMLWICGTKLESQASRRNKHLEGAYICRRDTGDHHDIW